GPPSAFAAKGATSTIPVVFSAASDPVEIGLVPSLNQQGGNVTGMALFSASLGTKAARIDEGADAKRWGDWIFAESSASEVRD
ncbi:MAG: ABC transporter substrate binding protein, partial [Pseudolabrys sp.]